MRLLCAAALLLSLGLFLGFAHDKKDAPSTEARAAKLKEIQKKFDEDFGELEKKFQKAETQAERQGVRTEAKELATLTAEKAVKLAAENPKDPPAFDAAAFVLGRLMLFGVADADADKAAAIITEHHLGNPRVKSLVMLMGQMGPKGQKLLKAAAEKATDKQVKGMALYFLGSALAEQADDADDEKTAEELTAKATAALEEAAKVAPDTPIGPETIGEAVKSQLDTLKAIKNLGVGKPAPDVEGTGLDDKKVKLSSFKGKVVLLDIWATWCGPCRAMIPHERELVKKLKDKPFVLLSVSADKEKDALTRFLDKEPMPWTHWWDGGERKVLKTFNVKAFPTMYLIDASGMIRKKWVGAPKDEVLEKAIEDAVSAAEKK